MLGYIAICVDIDVHVYIEIEIDMGMCMCVDIYSVGCMHIDMCICIVALFGLLRAVLTCCWCWSCCFG